MKFIIFIILFLLYSSLSQADVYSRAYDEYKNGQYDKALDGFKGALSNEKDRDNKDKLVYNIGNVCYKKNDYNGALANYTSVEGMDDEMKFRTYYNQGNTFYKLKKYEDAIEFYKKALDVNPSDVETKFNLEYVKNLLKNKEKNQDKKQQKKDQQQQNQQNQNQQQDQGGSSQQQQQQNSQQNNQGQENKNIENNKEGSQQEQEQKQEQQEQEKEEQKLLQQQEQEKQKQQQKETTPPKDAGTAPLQGHPSIEGNFDKNHTDQTEQKELTDNETDILLDQIEEDKQALKEVKKKQMPKQRTVEKDW